MNFTHPRLSSGGVSEDILLNEINEYDIDDLSLSFKEEKNDAAYPIATENREILPQTTTIEKGHAIKKQKIRENSNPTIVEKIQIPKFNNNNNNNSDRMSSAASSKATTPASTTTTTTTKRSFLTSNDVLKKTAGEIALEIAKEVSSSKNTSTTTTSTSIANRVSSTNSSLSSSQQQQQIQIINIGIHKFV